MTMKYTSLLEVREQIDRIDSEMVKLISERSNFVKQAATFKKDREDVKAPKRVEAVIEKVKILAEEFEVDSTIIEKVYRTMIGCFIEMELVEHMEANDRSFR